MLAKEDFDFELKDTVCLKFSAEKGVIIGRAQYTNQNPQYYVRYTAADGRLVEQWWPEDALSLEALSPKA